MPLAAMSMQGHEIEKLADVRVFDGRGPGGPPPTPEFCNFAVSAGDRILVVFDD